MRKTQMEIFGKSTIVLYKNWHWFIRAKGVKVKTKKRNVAPSQALPKTNFFEANKAKQIDKL